MSYAHDHHNAYSGLASDEREVLEMRKKMDPKTLVVASWYIVTGE
jgi:hypothetical protein